MTAQRLMCTFMNVLPLLYSSRVALLKRQLLWPADIYVFTHLLEMRRTNKLLKMLLQLFCKSVTSQNRSMSAETCRVDQLKIYICVN